MIAPGRAVTLAMLGLCLLTLGVPARAQINAQSSASSTRILRRPPPASESGVKPLPRPLPRPLPAPPPKPLPPPRPVPLPFPIRPLPPAPPPRPNPSLVRVPDLSGLTPQQGVQTLRRAGLTPGRQGQTVT